MQKGKGRKVRVKKDVKKEKNVRKDEAKKKKTPSFHRPPPPRVVQNLTPDFERHASRPFAQLKLLVGEPRALERGHDEYGPSGDAQVWWRHFGFDLGKKSKTTTTRIR